MCVIMYAVLLFMCHCLSRISRILALKYMTRVGEAETEMVRVFFMRDGKIMTFNSCPVKIRFYMYRAALKGMSRVDWRDKGPEAR